MDPKVANYPYLGPKAPVADICGSVLWGLRVDQVNGDRKQRGWGLTFSERVSTPYGLGPLVNHYKLPRGREAIWIPSYGAIRGEDLDPSDVQHRLFWILMQAGVKVLFVGGTSGTNDWRGLSTEESIRPGDFVLPWSFYRGPNMAGTLPDTGIGGVLPNLAQMASPFCPTLSDWLANYAEQTGHFRRVHRPKDVRVILRSPTGGTFESEGETAAWRVLTKVMSETDNLVYAMLHGDCVSPILCRHLGIHEAYFHIAVNWAEGHPATSTDLTETLDQIYVHDLPQIMLDFGALVLETIPIPGPECPCITLLKKRPDVYQDAMTQR